LSKTYTLPRYLPGISVTKEKEGFVNIDSRTNVVNRKEKKKAKKTQ